jgi:hypothetical protein
MNDLCVQPHDSDRRAADSLRLCHPCRNHLSRLITGLPARYADLEDRLSVTGTSGDRVSGSSSTPLPINTAVAGCRYDIQHTLVSWALYVAEERGLMVPMEGSDPRHTAPWLAKHSDWLAADRAGSEECLPAMRDLTGRSWALIDPSGRKRIKVGPCTQTGDDGPCAGVLYATVRAEDDVRPSAIFCDTCDLEIAPESWLRFGRTYQRERTTA